MRIGNRTTRRLALAATLLAACLAWLPSGEAATPWALLARRAIGRVEQMNQPPKGDQPGFDVATVILNADAAKVYATAVGMLHKSELVHILADDPARRTVEFGNGERSARITVTDLGTKLSQLMVASTALPWPEDLATMRVVDGVVRVCQAMKVTCSVR